MAWNMRGLVSCDIVCESGCATSLLKNHSLAIYFVSPPRCHERFTKASSNFAIHLDGAQGYEPGGLVTGRVVRRTHIVSPNALVTIKLFGRTKAKMVVNGSNGSGSKQSIIARGSPLRVDDPPRLPRTYPHRKEVARSCTFHLRSRSHARPSPGISSNHSAQDSFLSLDQAEIFRHGLPFSFYCYDASDEDQTLECFCRIRPRGKPATRPRLEDNCHEGGGPDHHSATPVAADARFPSSMERSCGIAAFPEAAARDGHRADLSFREKVLKVLHSSKVPKLSYAVHVESPGILQLGTVFPFRLQVAPDREASSDGIALTDLAFRLIALDLTIEKRTRTCLVASTWSKHESHAVTRHEFRIASREPLVVPSGSDGQVLDIGTRMGLQQIRGRRYTSMAYFRSGNKSILASPPIIFGIRIGSCGKP